MPLWCSPRGPVCSLLSARLGVEEAEAERWIVELIRSVNLQAKIDSNENAGTFLSEELLVASALCVGQRADLLSVMLYEDYSVLADGPEVCYEVIASIQQ